ncbi:hypothetical protein WICPIJ_007326 [Wickerhamomyces pijperi]|uniref:Uncharacterized protein n=2 Tax=Wickerhamomyces TaxID=599737 RepID=A0A9P8TK26_WICPI|nr:hypothetical protein WICPIJ_007326 [Wickerhamomyces pijperi]
MCQFPIISSYLHPLNRKLLFTTSLTPYQALPHTLTPKKSFNVAAISQLKTMSTTHAKAENQTPSIPSASSGDLNDPYTQITALQKNLAILQHALSVEKSWRYGNGGSDLRWIPSEKYDQLLENNAYLVSKVLKLQKKVARLEKEGASTKEFIDLEDSDDEKDPINRFKIKPEELIQPIVKPEKREQSIQLEILDDMLIESTIQKPHVKSEAPFISIPKPKTQPTQLSSAQMFNSAGKSTTAPAPTKTLLFQGKQGVNQDKVKEKLDLARGFAITENSQSGTRVKKTSDRSSSEAAFIDLDDEPTPIIPSLTTSTLGTTYKQPKPLKSNTSTSPLDFRSNSTSLTSSSKNPFNFSSVSNKPTWASSKPRALDEDPIEEPRLGTLYSGKTHTQSKPNSRSPSLSSFSKSVTPSSSSTNTKNDPSRHTAPTSGSITNDKRRPLNIVELRKRQKLMNGGNVPAMGGVNQDLVDDDLDEFEGYGSE